VDLSSHEIVTKAEACMDKLKFERAVALLDEGLRRFPNDTAIIDLYTDLLIQLGEHHKAQQVRLVIIFS
jgi:protein involved in temperature-dependent protein secretion